MMNDKDKYSAHLEYLKVAITISTALLAVAAAIFSDSSKMPVDASRYALLTSAGFVFVTLVDRIRRFERSLYALTRWNCGKAGGLNRLILSTSFVDFCDCLSVQFSCPL
jgi:hypothetical protein